MSANEGEILLTVFLKHQQDKNLSEINAKLDEAGFLPKERRKIEAGLSNGDLLAVISTSALELGIDIGGMGAAVLAGYPGTIAGTWHQARRAGRSPAPNRRSPSSGSSVP